MSTPDAPALSDYARGLRDAAAMLEMDNQTIRLHAGELSPDEMRVVRTMLAWKRREMLARAERAATRTRTSDPIYMALPHIRRCRI